MRHGALLGFAALALAGCSLEESGQAPTLSDAGPPDVAKLDATVDASGDVTLMDTGIDTGIDVIEEPAPPLPCTTDASVCTGAIPGGWTLTMFSPNRSTSCPVNAVTADVVATPVAGAGACTCNCNITTQPSCVLGTVNGSWGNGSCNTNWGPWTFTTPGQCVDLGVSVNLANGNNFSKLPVTPGQCTGAPAPDTSKVTTTGMRTCTPAAACAEDVCNGQVPAGLRSCIASNGDVACPVGPFSQKVAVVGAASSLACGACTACSVTQTGCGTATVKYWDDANCTVATGSIVADGKCNATGNVHANHITYESQPQNVQCAAGTSAATVDLTAKKTICCRP
jgi:hypothetical protein